MTPKKPIPESISQGRDRLKSKSLRRAIEALNAAVRDERLVVLRPVSSDVSLGFRPRASRRKTSSRGPSAHGRGHLLRGDGSPDSQATENVHSSRG